jgi:hypothetical protein
MSKEFRNRMDRIEGKVSPSRYATLEDIIHAQDIEEKEKRTPEEELKLKELRSLPIDPQLVKALMKAKKKGNG